MEYLDAALRFNTIKIDDQSFLRLDHAQAAIHLLTGAMMPEIQMIIFENDGLLKMQVMPDATYVEVTSLRSLISDHGPEIAMSWLEEC